MQAMTRTRRILLIALFAVLLCGAASARWQTAGRAIEPRERESRLLWPGANYTHLSRSTPAGEPWSIHVLEISRRSKGLELRAVRGAGSEGEMQRVRPTQMATLAAAEGLHVLAVVNGDYDLAAPYLGVSDGLSIESGAITTTGKPDWPAMGVSKKGEPVIAVPEVVLEARVGRQRWRLAALNKPLGSAHGAGPRLFTRAFRTVVKSEVPFRAAVVGRLDRALPLPSNGRVRGEVLEAIDSAREISIPPDAIVIADRLQQGQTDGGMFAALRPGARVEVRISVRMAGRGDVRHAVGGFPILVQEGLRRIAGEPGANLRLRHPRTAVCTSREKIVFAVVDGRQPKLSVGMTLEELGDLMVGLGCETAMNTDGGGSSVMAVAEGDSTGEPPLTLRIVNSPSDGQERGRGNAWVLIRRH
jgi:hypothetical protein